MAFDLAPDLATFGWCPFASVAGQPCILCGGSRATVRLFRGDLFGALQANASVVLLLAVVGVTLVVVLMREGLTGVRTRVGLLVAPPQDRQRVNRWVLLVFAVWWGWNLGRW